MDGYLKFIRKLRYCRGDNMSNIECPSFKPDCSGDCKYHGVDYDEDTGCLVHYCICDGGQLKFKDCCDVYAE